MNNPFDSIDERLVRIENLLLEIKINSSERIKIPLEDEILTIQQAGKLINLSVPSIYGLVHESKIPVSKKGRRLYFSKQELMKWIKTGRRKTLAEIEKEAESLLSRKKA